MQNTGLVETSPVVPSYVGEQAIVEEPLQCSLSDETTAVVSSVWGTVLSRMAAFSLTFLTNTIVIVSWSCTIARIIASIASVACAVFLGVSAFTTSNPLLLGASAVCAVAAVLLWPSKGRRLGR